MSELETTRRSNRSPVLALVQWLLLIAVAFSAVAGGMTWLSQSVDIPSPVAGQALASGTDLDLPGATGDGTLPAPNFRLATLDGGVLGPPDFPGKVVLVEFWATWCGPCRLQAKFLEELHEELDGKDVEFLAINVGEDLTTVKNYVAKTPFPYPVLLDTEDSLAAPYQIFGLPTVMIVDRQGAITFLETGVSPVDRLRQKLEAAGLTT